MTACGGVRAGVESLTVTSPFEGRVNDPGFLILDSRERICIS